MRDRVDGLAAGVPRGTVAWGVVAEVPSGQERVSSVAMFHVERWPARSGVGPSVVACIVHERP